MNKIPKKGIYYTTLPKVLVWDDDKSVSHIGRLISAFIDHTDLYPFYILLEDGVVCYFKNCEFIHMIIKPD